VRAAHEQVKAFVRAGREITTVAAHAVRWPARPCPGGEYALAEARWPGSSGGHTGCWKAV